MCLFVSKTIGFIFSVRTAVSIILFFWKKTCLNIWKLSILILNLFPLIYLKKLFWEDIGSAENSDPP